MKYFRLLLFSLFLLQFNLLATNYYVKTPADGGDDSHDGTSWATAKATIQAAITSSTTLDEIYVKYGTYVLNSQLNFSARQKFTSDDGTHTDWYSAKTDSSLCILQGNGCRIFYSSSNTNQMTVIRGFKITNGNATTEASYAGKGGGMLLKDGGLIVERCWIIGNIANTGGDGYGGGIAFVNAWGGVSPIIRNCRFENNIASDISNNFGNGGAVFCDNGHTLTFQNNIVDNNTASTNYYGYGGGLFTYTSNTITGNIFSNNYATKSASASYYGQGGAIDNYAANSTITNNTFYKNATGPNQASPNSYNLGSGIYSTSNTSVTVKNNIFSDHNLQGSDRTAIYSDNADITISYNSFYNNTTKYNSRVTSTNEIVADPKFVNAADGDFSLQSTSPCIDAGDPATSVAEGGEPAIDLGAFEFIHTALKSIAGVDGTIGDNKIPGVAISFASQSGTISADVQQFLGDPSNIPDGSKHIGKYWSISSITGGNAKLRLYFCSEAVASFTGTPIIYHYTGSAWESLPTEAAVTVGCCKYVETTNYYSSFSNVTVGDGNAPLPVELTSFAANIQNNVVNLKWTTATEVNNYGFEVQRTIKNSKFEIQNWASVGFVKGNGNSNSSKEYSFVDKNISNGKYSYRLKQIDNNGSFKYSDEVEVEINIPLKFVLEQNYPNPFNPSTTISFSIPEDNHVLLKLYDILGREVKTLINENRKAGTHTLSFNVSSAGGGLSNGIYIYKIVAGKYSGVKKMLLLK